MVTVPTYQRDVSLRPINQQGLTVQASAEDMGAAVGRGMQQLGQGLGQAAQAMAQVQELKDQARAREQRNAYMRDRDALLYDPQNGYLNSQGRNAIDGRDALTQKMGELRKKYAEGLTPAQSVLFNQAVEPLEMDAQRSAMVHAGGELKKYVVDQGNASADAFREEAIRNVGNKAMADKYLSAGIMELREIGKQQGLPAEQIALKEKEYVSTATSAMVKQLALKDPLAADAFMKENSNRLTEGDRITLESALQESVYAAKGQRNAQDIMGGAPVERSPVQSAPDPNAVERRPLPDIGAKSVPDDGGSLSTQGDLIGEVMKAAPNTPEKFSKVVGSLYGLNERTDGAALSSFIKRTTGISIDPSVTPWCAAFVNAVLGSQGVQGTGSLMARSFLNFGMATDAPKPGDIVVLSRGGNSVQGHVGFFQGYDENGNIRVLGGNQGNSVNVSTYSADRVLGFRTAGAVNSDTAALPNYSVGGLMHIQERLAGITDPLEYAATAKAIDTMLSSQKKMMDAQRDQVTDYVGAELLRNPSLDLMNLPMDVKQALGKTGMTSMIEFQDKLRTQGQPTTDDSLLFDLMTMDPDQLAGMTKEQLFQARPKLNNADWEKVRTRYASAQSDINKVKEEHLNLTSAFSQAESQLAAVGISTAGKDGSARDEASKRIAKFQGALSQQMDEFKRSNNGRNPNQMEIQSMVNRLLLPIVIKTPGMLYGTNDQEALMFEAGQRSDNSTVDVVVKYEDIPVDLRRGISTRLETELGRKPSEDEVVQEYEAFILNR